MADCEHETVLMVRQAQGPTIWLCGEPDCRQEFVPSTALEQLERETNGAIDMSCAMFARIMVDVCRQMGVSPPVFSEDKTGDCETDGHMWSEDDKCLNCGASKFLGG